MAKKSVRGLAFPFLIVIATSIWSGSPDQKVVSARKQYNPTTVFRAEYEKNPKMPTVAIQPPDPLAAPTLSLQEVTSQVVQRNPNLAAARSRIKAASAAISPAKTVDDPEFRFRTMDNAFRCTTHWEKEHRYELFQKVPWFGKLQTKGKIAEHIWESVQADKVTTHQELVLQAKRVYFQLHLNYVAITINQQNRSIIKRLMQGALAMYKTGKGSQADSLKAQIELQELDNELLSLESEHGTLTALLNVLLNRDQQAELGHPQMETSSAIVLAYDQLESLAMRFHPELHSQQARVDEHDARKHLAQLEYFPDFTFEFMVQSKPKEKTHAWGLSVGMNVPIWIPRKQRYQVIEAEELVATNQSVLAGMRATIRGRIKALLVQFKAIEERIALYATGLLTKTATTLASNEANYKVGKSDFLTVLDTRRQLYNFELDYERARVEREILLAELERAVGIPVEKFPRISLAQVQPALSTDTTQLSGSQTLHKTKESDT